MSESEQLMGNHPNRTMPVPDAGASAAASAHAPFLYFDVATYVGLTSAGIASVTLEALRHMSGLDGKPAKDFVVTAHLRIGLSAVKSLRHALQEIERLAGAPTEGIKPN